jgi:hypothetical protein
MADNQQAERLHLWISYPWLSKEERDFTYLVAQLKDKNIEAIYDSVQLLPEVHLWERTVQRLRSIDLDGWLYILTHQCFTRRTCTDELTAAINQALLSMGPDFPMIGLLYDIAVQHVPPMIRVLPCVSLGDPEWKQQISHVLRQRAPHDRNVPVRKDISFIWKIHASYCDNPALTAVEVRPDQESIQSWRFAIPKSAQAIRWGQGPSGGGEISRILYAEAKGSGKYGNRDVTWFGADNGLSNSESAYVVFSGALPDFICFGSAKNPYGPPGQMEVFWTASSDKTADPSRI